MVTRTPPRGFWGKLATHRENIRARTLSVAQLSAWLAEETASLNEEQRQEMAYMEYLRLAEAGHRPMPAADGEAA